MERRLAAVLFSDIVGYTALMAESEVRGLRARQRHRDLLRPLAARYQGQIVDETGDELLLVFPSGLDAVNCALAAQEALRYDPELTLRIGIHAGDVIFEGGRVYGDGVNVASRIRPLAEPGGVAVSEPVFEAIKNQPGMEATPLGEQPLKHVARPLAVYAVTGSPGEPHRLPAEQRAPALRWIALALGLAALGGLILLAWPPEPATTPSAPPLTAIAVLPFDDISPDGDQVWLARGMAEQLIESLSRIEELRVISRTSSEVAKASGADIPTIGERLRVGAVVEGSVHRTGDDVRVTAQLIRVADESHLWSARYERTLDHVFAIQREIARDIAEAVRLQLGIGDWSWIAAARYAPKDVRAYEHMRRGFEFHYQYSEEALREAEKHYLAALEIERDYYMAEIGLMWNHWQLWLGYEPTEGRLASARAAAQRALALDEGSAGAHAFLAWQRVFVWDYASAERWLDRAIEMNPGLVMYLYPQVLADTGRVDEALAYVRKGVEVDPLFSGSYTNMGNMYLYAGNYEAAIEELEHALELNPQDTLAAGMLALAYHRSGMDKEALDALLRAPDIAGNPELEVATRRSFEEGGWQGMNRAIVAQVAAQTGRTCSVNPTTGAYLYAQSGDADETFRCLEEALAQGRMQLGVGHPTWDPYRDDPRFQALLARVGLAD